MTPEKELELVKDCLQTEGGHILLERINEHLKASDTVKVLPVVQNGTVVLSQTESLAKQQGYVLGIEAVLGLMEHYLKLKPEDLDQDEDNL